MFASVLRSLTLLVLSPCLLFAQGSGEVQGIVKEKPTSGRFVETPQGFMVPYEAKLPGSEVIYRMQPIPGGKVKVGSPDSEAGRQPDEGPQFEVTIEPFWIAEREVNWAQYKFYMSMHDQLKKLYEAKIRPVADPKSELVVTAPSNLYDPTFTFKQGADPEQPAVTMSQFAAKQFTKWLSGTSGQFIRLPSEAEWEYACRAGATTAYHFGDDPKDLGVYAWYFENGGETTHKVGLKKPNAWGLYDMHGNVGEWVLDEYVADGYKAHAGQTLTVKEAIQWPKKLFPRIVKGGGWDDEPANCRAAARQQSDDDGWRSEDPNFPQSPWWFTSEPALSVGFRPIRPLKAPATMAERNKYWDADIQQIRDDVNQRVDKEGRGARGIADPELPADLKKLEAVK